MIESIATPLRLHHHSFHGERKTSVVELDLDQMANRMARLPGATKNFDKTVAATPMPEPTHASPYYSRRAALARLVGVQLARIRPSRRTRRAAELVTERRGG